jgi:hypothetical protein
MRPERAADSNYNLCTIHIRPNQLPILPFLHLQLTHVAVEFFSGMF